MKHGQIDFAFVEHRFLTGFAEFLQVVRQFRAVAFRGHKVCGDFSDDEIAGVSKDLFGGSIEINHPSLTIGHNNGGEGPANGSHELLMSICGQHRSFLQHGGAPH